MTKRQTRLFFFVGTGLFAAIFIALTIDSHRQFGILTNAHLITADVTEGKHIWHEKNCINCHTLLGEGAYFAPDLTKITQHRGEAYLTAFLQDPSQFYSEEEHRRLMPNPELGTWRSRRSSRSSTGSRASTTRDGRPARSWSRGAPFRASPWAGRPPRQPPTIRGPWGKRSSTPVPGCFACHSTAPDVQMVGPSMAGVGGRAETVIAAPDYTGSVTDAESYIRESILDPNAYLVPGPTFSAGGISFMPQNTEDLLTAEEIDQLVSYLMTLR